MSDAAQIIKDAFKNYAKEFLNLFEFQSVILISVIIYIYVNHATEDLQGVVPPPDKQKVSTINILNFTILGLMFLCLFISPFAVNINIFYLIIWVCVLGLSITNTVLINELNKQTKPDNNDVLIYNSKRYNTAYIMSIIIIVLSVLFFGVDLLLYLIQSQPKTA